MKTILVLTDFSENALRAAETAATLTEKLNANLLLFNANYIVPAVPYYPGVILVNENISWEAECEKKLNQLAGYLKQIVSEVKRLANANRAFEPSCWRAIYGGMFVKLRTKKMLK